MPSNHYTTTLIRSIIEILSPSTERYDRGKKFHHYQTIATLKEYMLIAQDEHRIEHYTKHDDDTWRFSTYNTIQASIPIPTIQCTLALEDIYDKVDIEPISDEDDLPTNNEMQP